MALAASELFLFDESHMCPADTFESVCMGVAGGARLRFFTSATQMRNDGSEMLLRGITGPIVYGKSFRELVSQGYLAHPFVKMFHVPARAGAGKQDPKVETRNQLYLNPYVNQLAGEIATKSITLAKRQTLVILEQFDQFVQLRPFLGVVPTFVHGGATTKEVREILPQEYWKVDDNAVAKFNRREINLLVGTSAIATGVDTKACETIVYLQGGTSEIKLRQAIGRGGSQNSVMAATSRTKVRATGKMFSVTTTTASGSLLANCGDATGPCTTHTATGAVFGNSPDQNRAALVAVVAAEVDPPQPIRRPHPAPAAVVGGVGKGRADERKAMEAMTMMDKVAVAPEPET